MSPRKKSLKNLSYRDALIDLEQLYEAMPTKRFVEVIRRFVLEDCEPETLAQEMTINTANLYNIKRRSIA